MLAQANFTYVSFIKLFRAHWRPLANDDLLQIRFHTDTELQCFSNLIKINNYSLTKLVMVVSYFILRFRILFDEFYKQIRL